MFAYADKDQSGFVNTSEFEKFAPRLDALLDTSVVGAFQRSDLDGDGQISSSDCLLCGWGDSNNDTILSEPEFDLIWGSESPFAALWISPMLQIVCAWLAYRLIDRPWCDCGADPFC